MKKINENKKIIYIVILIVLIGMGLFFKYKKDSSLGDPTTPPEIVIVSDTITIKTTNIKEKNFSAKISVIEGSGELATKAQSYIDETLAEFKKQADVDVPAMRAEFGEDIASAQYELIIDAKYTKSEDTESIVLLEYNYTGGAHGNSSYKVITASNSGNVLSLKDVIKAQNQNDFMSLLKKELLAWRPYDDTESVVFTEEVDRLTLDSLLNWSLDDQNLTIYFSQYEIGPGVLGPVAFPIKIEKIKSFLE